MSQGRRGITFAALGVFLMVGGCATRGQLERAVEAERAERIAGDQQVAADVERMGTDMQRMASNVDQLRTDLAAMDTDFGAKLTQLEEGMQLTVPVHFGFDEADVSPQATPVLDRFAQLVQRHYPDATITVEGFADPAGPAEYNRRLAQSRAETVREALVARGLPETQLRAVGYGEDRLVVPNAAGNQFGAELNRRVVFVIETPAGTALTSPTASRQ
jgi:outer membrane protein OmpA-like peptidoglycan-associated protein